MAKEIQSEVIEGPPLRRHAINLAAPLGWAIVMMLPVLIISTLLGNLGYTDYPTVRVSLWLFSGAYGIFVVSFFMMQWIFWYLDAWFLTKHRLIDIQLNTLFNRRVAQLPLNQIQDVRTTVRGSLASIFKFGDITVQSAGREGFFELKSIPNAREVADRISQLCENRQEDISRNVVDKISKPTQRLGEILIRQGALSQDGLTSSLQDQHASGKRLGRILLERNLISREDLVRALGSQYRIPSIDLSRYYLEPEVVREMPYEMAAKYLAIPVSRSPETMTVAIAEPSPEKIGELAAQFDTPLAFMVADEDYIREAITGHYLVGREDQNDEPGDREVAEDAEQQVGDIIPH